MPADSFPKRTRPPGSFGGGAILVLTFAFGCTEREPTQAPVCEDLQRVDLRQELVDTCSACFIVDETTGRGTCRATPATLDTPEIVAVLASAASSRDGWKADCPDRVEHLDPLAELVVTNAPTYVGLEDLKEDVALGVDGTTLEVRINHGCDDEGNCWGGLYLYLDSVAGGDQPTCCVGSDCGGCRVHLLLECRGRFAGGVFADAVGGSRGYGRTTRSMADRRLTAATLPRAAAERSVRWAALTKRRS